jgi:hypothetical protein
MEKVPYPSQPSGEVAPTPPLMPPRGLGMPSSSLRSPTLYICNSSLPWCAVAGLCRNYMMDTNFHHPQIVKKSESA